MPRLTFYHLGNADACLMDLDNGKKLLFDYGNEGNPDDPNDKRANLPTLLRNDLDAAQRNHYEVFAITHLDQDHVMGAPAFFHLDHDPRYQKGNRARINTLWVPAAVIVDDDPSLHDDAKVMQKEARYRFRQGRGIRVFSKPDKLKEWAEKQGLAWGSVANLVFDAGTMAPDFTTAADGLEIFIHSPFAGHVDDCTLKRNDAALVFQATFTCSLVTTRVLMCADVEHAGLSDIVKITRRKGNEARLEWDVVKTIHHSSYLGLGPDKGADETQPTEEIKWLFETQGADGCIIISSSKPIPSGDTDNQPPHRSAANYYKSIKTSKGGDWIVTMENPSEKYPEPTIIDISSLGPKLKKRASSAGSYASGVSSPRAGWWTR